VFDDWFTTVDLDPNEIPEFDSPQWECLFENTFFYDTDSDDGNLPQFHTEYLEEQDGPLKEQRDHVAQKKVETTEVVPAASETPILAHIAPSTQALEESYQIKNIPNVTMDDTRADNIPAEVETSPLDSLNSSYHEAPEPVPHSPSNEQREQPQFKNGHKAALVSTVN
jgi:hypothetical protein